ncbi:hypothetical protein PROFUN_12472 [Planoprotostelium fungivorum]|uniref:Dynein regulatory complex protein 1 n=1 Tax=Planoprotostelium fungivorum TaxID=1890364 RepID=A0A2P6N7E6_9EUKA|nr:hypothetical protein PROFUN_12472 [Planoprotostelium fungivorum]
MAARMFLTTNSTEREERILARRARIAARMEQKKRALNPELSAATKVSEAPTEPLAGTGEKAKKQIADSRNGFNLVLENGIQDVSSVKAWIIQREEVRKEEQKKRMAELAIRRAEEKKEADTINDSIAERWAVVAKKDVPEELRKSIAEVISSKDKLIKEYSIDIKAKEEEYVKTLAKQAEEIDQLIQKMRNQVKDLAKSYEQEMSAIDDSFLEERHILRKANAEEMEVLYEDRRNNEGKYAESRQERDEEARQQIETLQTIEAEEYNELKIKLETEIQTLEQHLQVMKATFQLNHEKLTHNFRLLDERNFEHTQLIQQQKKKINRLQDMGSTLKARYEKNDKKYRQKNIELTEEYKRTTDQYKDLQAIFKNFQEKDHRKYKEVWNMNEERVSVLVNRLIQGDKIIAEQQLGLLWFPPTEDIYAISDTRTGDHSTGLGVSPSKSAENPLQHEDMKPLIQMLCDEAGFLVDDKVKNVIGGIRTNEQNMIMIDSILSVLGVESPTAVESLISYFVKNDYTQEKPELIAPTEAMAALKSFVKDHQVRIKEGDGDDEEQDLKFTVAIEQLTTTSEEKEEKIQKVIEKEYWQRLANVVPEKTVQTWESLEKELVKYNQVLTARSDLLRETDSIRKQNDELKTLLNQYINAKVTSAVHDLSLNLTTWQINEELIVPVFKHTRD